MGHEKSLKHPSNSYPGQLAGYVLAGTAAFYLEARYGGEWQQVSELSLQATDPPLLMNDFRPGVGCCTIAALTATFRQIGRTYGRSLIPVDEHDLFDQIESLAAHHGYRPKRGRTNPLCIGSIARHLLRSFQIDGKAGSSLFLPAHKIRRELDDGHPVLMNIAFGHYRRHTVTGVGYQLWQDTSQQAKNRRRFLWQVHDGWSQDVRFIDHWALTRPWSGHWTVYSVTRIRPEPTQLRT